MDILNIAFGVIGIVSFIFSIYIYFKGESKKVIEASKNATHLERLRNTKNSLGGVYNTIDMIIQLPKKGSISPEQMQDLARVARQQIGVLAKQIELEENQIVEWKFGESQVFVKQTQS